MEFPSIDRSFFLGDCFDAYRICSDAIRDDIANPTGRNHKHVIPHANLSIGPNIPIE